MRRRALLSGAAAGSLSLAGCVMQVLEELAEQREDQSDNESDGGNNESDDNQSDNGDDGDDGNDGSEVHEDYETTEVRVETPGGEHLGTVTAAIADTLDLRYTGLSETDTLPEDRGMLFVYSRVGDWRYVMRDMDFGLDIVYVDADGTITKIHHAPAPGPNEDGSSQSYPGRGQYVLEVNYGWTTERGVTEGDVLAFELPE
jgi:uncharacterized membrane protein (UPF0127 family)